jgi:hypothetical protein
MNLLTKIAKYEFKTPPFFVTFLSMFVLCMMPWYAVRIYSAIANWQVLSEFGANPAYILGTGALWMLGSLWASWQIWEGYPSAGRAGWMMAVFYLAWYWFDRLAIQPSPATNAVYSLGLSAALFTVVALILLLPSTRAFFTDYPRRQHERKNLEDSSPE